MSIFFWKLLADSFSIASGVVYFVLSSSPSTQEKEEEEEEEEEGKEEEQEEEGRGRGSCIDPRPLSTRIICRDAAARRSCFGLSSRVFALVAPNLFFCLLCLPAVSLPISSSFHLSLSCFFDGVGKNEAEPRL